MAQLYSPPTTSFFLQINKLGSIEQVIWSEPVGALPEDAHTIYSLFSREDKTPLLRALKRCALNDGAFFLDAPMRMQGETDSMAVCLVPLKKNYLVFATDETAMVGDTSGSGVRSMVLMFLNVIRNLANKSAAAGSGAGLQGVEQTEMIQTLVGELKDRKQKLEEANTKLNTINEDLNSRLVKDALTGLVSRYQYRSEIELLIGKNPGKLGVFVFLDIDDFKKVNDKYGHAAGDQYLVEFANRLKQLPYANMLHMRIAGDEFGLFLFGLDDCLPGVMEDLWSKIKQYVLAKPIEAGGKKLPIGVSAGMAVYGCDTTEIYDLIERADHAMYAAKRKGKNRYSVFGQ